MPEKVTDQPEKHPRVKIEDVFAREDATTDRFVTNDGLHELPYWVWGKLKEATNIVIVHHGGPGDSIKPEDIAPFLDRKGTVVVAYDQRLSGKRGKEGRRPSKFLGKGSLDPLDSHTPKELVGDVRQLIEEELKIDQSEQNVIHAGASWGSGLALLCAENIPGSKGVIVSAATLCEDEETIRRYSPDGDLAETCPEAFREFIELVPKDRRNDPFAIVNYYNEQMNPETADYDKNRAKALATTFGILNMSAKNPLYGMLRHVPVEGRLLVGRLLGMNPILFARLAMRGFAVGFREIDSGEFDGNPGKGNSIIRNLGKIAVMAIISGKSDALTPLWTADELQEEAEKAGVTVKREIIPGGHGRKSLNAQAALKKSLDWTLKQIQEKSEAEQKQ